MRLTIALLDYNDSYTWNLYALMHTLGVNVKVYTYNEPKALKGAIKADGVVLSPGPGNPKNIKETHIFLNEMVEKKPIFGVCLGHQSLGLYFGSQLATDNQPVHGYTSPIVNLDPDKMFKNIPEVFDVMRYHSLSLDPQLSNILTLTAKTLDGTCMAFKHNWLPIWGVQFHPESVLTTYGKEIFSNWISLF